MTVDVEQALGEVDVANVPVAVLVAELTADDGDVGAALDVEVHPAGGLEEVVAAPLEVAYSVPSVPGLII